MEPVVLAAWEAARWLAAAGLGLLAGALLAEGALLVPYWRTLTAQQFYALHPVYGPRLYRFYAPLTIAAPLAAVAAAALAAIAGATGRGVSIAAALLALALLACYPLFFKGANEAFARRAVPPEALGEALARWARWHWARTAIALAAFACSLFALQGALQDRS